MTWKEFVESVESQGVTDETEVDNPIVSLMHDGNTVVIEETHPTPNVDFD
jgi:hypothetical protein